MLAAFRLARLPRSTAHRREDAENSPVLGQRVGPAHRDGRTTASSHSSAWNQRESVLARVRSYEGVGLAEEGEIHAGGTGYASMRADRVPRFCDERSGTSRERG